MARYILKFLGFSHLTIGLFILLYTPVPVRPLKLSKSTWMGYFRRFWPQFLFRPRLCEVIVECGQQCRNIKRYYLKVTLQVLLVLVKKNLCFYFSFQLRSAIFPIFDRLYLPIAIQVYTIAAEVIDTPCLQDTCPEIVFMSYILFIELLFYF